MPTTEVELILAAEAERSGRQRCNRQLDALAEIYGVLSHERTRPLVTAERQSSMASEMDEVR